MGWSSQRRQWDKDRALIRELAIRGERGPVFEAARMRVAVLGRNLSGPLRAMLENKLATRKA